jgi:hypothetical protein
LILALLALILTPTSRKVGLTMNTSRLLKSDTTSSTKLDPRDLLHALFLSGDGNFHMQSKIHCKDIYADPSLFGNSAMFAPYALLQNYIEDAKKFRPKPKVSKSIYLAKMGSQLTIQRIRYAQLRQEVEKEIGQIVNSVKVAFMQFSASMGYTEETVLQISQKEKGKLNLTSE